VASTVALSADFVMASGALLVASISPLVLHWYNRKTTRADKEEDRQRRLREKKEFDEHRARDEQHRQEVSAKALEIAQNLMRQSQQLNQATRDNVSRLADAFSSARLGSNSMLITTLESELDAVERWVRTLKWAVALKGEAHQTVYREMRESIVLLSTLAEKIDSEITDHKREDLGLLDNGGGHHAAHSGDIEHIDLVGG
jgi:hypothetical protein